MRDASAAGEQHIMLLGNRRTALGILSMIILGVVLLFPSLPLASTERLTLMITGSACPIEFLEQALRSEPHVKSVDAHSVPGHVLVDVEKGSVKIEQLCHRIKQLSEDRCKAEPMKGCITPP